MRFTDLATGFPLHFDASVIVGVVPALAPPPAGIAPGTWIPKRIGSQLIIVGLNPVAVKGDADELALEVAAEKERARTPIILQ